MDATEVRRVRELLERSQFAAALAAAQKLLPQAPENRDVLYMIAVAQRYLQQVPEALATLTELERHHPGYGRLFQERGHGYVALRQAGPAIDAFLHGLVLNPSLPASWRALRELYRLTGQTAYAEDAAGHLARLEALPREIVVAFSMFADGEIYDAERVVRDYLLAHGNHVEGMRLLAQIGMKLDVVDDAEFLLENVMLVAPDHREARYEYALALLQRHKHVRAREEIQKLLDIDPDNRVYRTTHATICCGFGDYAEALPLYREILAETPRDPELHLSVGHAQKTLGHTQEAIHSYREAATARPDFGEAYWSLANLKTYRFTDDEIAVMRAEESSPKVRPVDRYHLCFALGKALEDSGEYDDSFAYYARGNALKKRECRYKPEVLEANARLQSEICTREFFEARRGFGSESTAPIFIVGLPRSGSTLIEQILASHSQVEGTMELADIPRFVHDLQGRTMAGSSSSYPAVLGTLDAQECRRLAQKYLDDTLVYRKLQRPFFIDKMPNNFRHLSLIHLMFPQARIIDARREPMACCFSNFKQLFASGQQFTYSFEDIARYYRMYLALMAHWDTALPGKILRVQHEDLVESVEAQVRRILDFCELEFEPACLAFHATERRIHTASSEQVRQPLNREGLDQWRHFEPWLGPLKALLAQGSV
jgi:tetratricopeptide (TPR) repeat protein